MATTVQLDAKERAASVRVGSERRERLLLALKAAAFVAFLVVLGRSLARADWSGATARLHGVGASGLLVLLPFPLALALDATAWKLVLARLGSRVPLARLFRVRLATEAVTTALPAGGIVAEALSPFLLAPSASIGAALTTSTTKRWLIIRTHGYYVGLAALVGFTALAASSRALLGHDGLPWIVLAAATALVAISFALEGATTRLGLAARVHDGVARLRGSRLFARFGVRELPRESFARIDADLARLGRSTHPLAAGLVLAAWLLESVESWLILSVLGVDVPWITVLSFDAALSVVRTAAAFAPAGLGAQDLGYLAFFEAFGVPGAAAVGPAFLVMKRAKDLTWVAVGVLVLLSLSRRRPTRSTEEPAMDPA